MTNLSSEVINLDDQEDEDRLRRDIYEDFDELADLAVTSCEPPPPGTRPLQEELLTLITENTVSGVTINKAEVAAWLRNEDALLTGGPMGALDLPFPSPPSSGDKDNSSDDEHHHRSGRSHSEKKMSSVVVRSRENSEKDRRSSSRHRRGDERRRHGNRESHRGKPESHRGKPESHRHVDNHRHHTGKRERDQAHDSSGKSRTRHTSRDRDSTRHSSHDNRTGSRHGSHDNRTGSRHGSHDNRTGSRRGSHDKIHGSHDKIHGSHDKIHGSHDKRHGSHDKIHGSHDEENTRSKRRSGEHKTLSRRVKINRKVDDLENDRNTSRYYKREVSPGRQTTTIGVRFGLKDAREILANRLPPKVVQEEDIISKYEAQIKKNEIEARKAVRQARHAKRDLEEYLSIAIKREKEELLLLEEKRRERERRRAHDTCSRDIRKRSHRQTSRDRSSRSEKTRAEKRHRSHHVEKSHRERIKSRDDENEVVTPESWKLLEPSEVDGFNCTGPAIFVQRFGRKVSRKDLFSHFKQFGTVVDIQLLELGKREKSACVIFSRQSEADKAIQYHRPRSRSVSHSSVEDTTYSPEVKELDSIQPDNTFDILLNALNRDD